MAYMGTIVVQGHGKAIITATGTDTQVGHISKMLDTTPVQTTPLQKKLGETGRILGLGALGICFLIFIIGLLRHIPVFTMFMTSISLAVAAIPEGLPAIVTVILAIGVQTMAKNNAIVKINAGAGGTESCDWASMLYRMYTRWAESKGYKTEVLDFLDGDEAGIKSITFQVNGENAYGYLKSEKGVHRLVRISPFNAAGKRQTSFASCDVMPDIEEDLDVEINDDDIRIDTYRSSGAGGQHINKTSSAVRITHNPTGIVVQCQNERSQLQNKDKAMKMLKAKLYVLKKQEEEEKRSGIRGEVKEIGWGSQIRSYVMQPYTMVKDHRTGEESGNVDAVLDGAIDNFISAYLRWMSLGCPNKNAAQDD